MGGVFAAGCYAAPIGSGSRGVSKAEHAGKVSLVFGNASPQRMCELRMTFDGAGKYGDNWLPAEGLPSGKSIEFKVKPGAYQATWATCREAGQPYFAATLTGDTAFQVKDATQLLAFVADKVAPTSRVALRDFHALVKFSGQPIDHGLTRQQPGQPVVARAAAPAEDARSPEVADAPTLPQTFDASFFDAAKPNPKGVKLGKGKAAKAKPAAHKKVVLRPSHKRTHDASKLTGL